MTTRRLWILVGVLAAAVAALGAVLGLILVKLGDTDDELKALKARAQEAAAFLSTDFPVCAWWIESTPQTANIALPDTSAAYWTMPFAAAKGLTIEIAGLYPEARYMSVDVYNQHGSGFTRNGVASGLADYLIPATKGENPFAVASAAPGGEFAVTLTDDVKKGQAGMLPLSDPQATTSPQLEKLLGGALGFVTYRVYLPEGGDYAAVSLPKVTIVEDGKRTTLETCPGQTGEGGVKEFMASATPQVASLAANVKQQIQAALEAQQQANAAAGQESIGAQIVAHSQNAFYRASSGPTNSLFPNVDNAYVTAGVKPPGGDRVVVIRGRVPAGPGRTAEGKVVGTGEQAVAWPEQQFEVRYWSLCSNVARAPYPVVANELADGTTSYGCAPDFQAYVDDRNRYVYVVGTEAQRQAIEAAGRGTFLPFSTDFPQTEHILLLRNMLPNDFVQAIQEAPQNGDPAATKKAMGDYYPEIGECPLSAFQSGGADACL